LEKKVAKAKGIDWKIAIKENPNLNERLDKLFDKKGPVTAGTMFGSERESQK
jgi:hypothetical protein